MLFVGKQENGNKFLVRKDNGYNADFFYDAGGKYNKVLSLKRNDEDRIKAMAILRAYNKLPKLFKDKLKGDSFIAYFVRPERTYNQSVMCFMVESNTEVPGHETEQGIIYIPKGDGIVEHEHTLENGDGEIYANGFVLTKEGAVDFGFMVNGTAMHKTYCYAGQSHGVDRVKEDTFLEYKWYEKSVDMPQGKTDIKWAEHINKDDVPEINSYKIDA